LNLDTAKAGGVHLFSHSLYPQAVLTEKGFSFPKPFVHDL